MPYLILYFLLPTFITAILLVINTKKKWLTRSKAKYYGADEFGISLLAFILWPVALVGVIIVLTLKFIRDHVLPND